jgi:hypothetical protein
MPRVVAVSRERSRAGRSTSTSAPNRRNWPSAWMSDSIGTVAVTQPVASAVPVLSTAARTSEDTRSDSRSSAFGENRTSASPWCNCFR